MPRLISSDFFHFHDKYAQVVVPRNQTHNLMPKTIHPLAMLPKVTCDLKGETIPPYLLHQILK